MTTTAKYEATDRETKAFLTVSEWCKATGSGRNRFYHELNSGRLVARKYGRRTIVLREDFLVWLRSLPLATSCGE